jgi:hypothetical protein
MSVRVAACCCQYRSRYLAREAYFRTRQRWKLNSDDPVSRSDLHCARVVLTKVAIADWFGQKMASDAMHKKTRQRI